MIILDNCCNSTYLDLLKNAALGSENWNLKYPAGSPIEKRHLKLAIIDAQFIREPTLAGMAMGLLSMIYDVSSRDLFKPKVHWCGISMKDKYFPNNLHTDHADHEEKDKFIKILGIINSDWEEEWGGGFFHNGTLNYIKPTSFCIFNPLEPHSAGEIFTDKKRFAIDFTVEKVNKTEEETWMKERP
jgi:hypothetical protein